MGFFSYPYSVPSQNHNSELNLIRLLMSCDKSELDLDCSEISLCSSMGKVCLEHKHHSITSGLTSAFPPSSPVPDVFPPSAVLKREELGLQKGSLAKADAWSALSWFAADIFTFLDNCEDRGLLKKKMDYKAFEQAELKQGRALSTTALKRLLELICLC